MRYGSVCSGIEAASVAWKPLGWQPVFFSEIDKFPSAVLAHHYGSNMPDEPPSGNGVPNYGDMTNFKEWPDHAIDVLVGGTPCQSYSVAGLRQGLADPRGDLMLTYGAVAQRYRPKWIVWENVPGVLSSNGGRDFGTFLGLLGQLGYGFAYRVLDAQFVRVDGFGRAVPQRRRRVFVVGYLGDWRPAAAVLLEPESLSGNSAPSRKTTQDVAGTIAASAARSRGAGQEPGGLVPDVASTLGGASQEGGFRTTDLDGTGAFVPEHVAARMVAFGEYADDGSASTVKARDHKDATDLIAFSSKDYGGDAETNLSPTLRAGGHDGSHANAGVPPAVAIQERAISENPNAGPDGAGVRDDGAAYTLEARQTPQAVAFKPSHYTRGKDGAPSEVMPPLSADADKGDQEPIVLMERGRSDGPNLEHRQDGTANAILTPSGGRGGFGVGAIAFAQNSRDEVRLQGGDGAISGALAAEPGMKQTTYLATSWAVRRLTPTETLRLQGFPDGYTQIPWRGKPAELCPDGPQYKSHGNSMAVPVMRWIGTRIEMIEELMGELADV